MTKPNEKARHLWLVPHPDEPLPSIREELRALVVEPAAATPEQVAKRRRRMRALNALAAKVRDV